MTRLATNARQRLAADMAPAAIPAAAAAPDARPPVKVPAAYGLTDREPAVLRLLAAGCTNAKIGAELYISPKTAGVHASNAGVHASNIVRKLGVSGRVQAAALAGRAGLPYPPQP